MVLSLNGFCWGVVSVGTHGGLIPVVRSLPKLPSDDLMSKSTGIEAIALSFTPRFSAVSFKISVTEKRLNGF